MKCRLLHNIGTEMHPNYNTREEIIACNDFLTFDGVYLNVYENQDVLKGKKGIFFIMGGYLGKDNTFDLNNVPKLEKYCTYEQVEEMANKLDWEIGWHTWFHSDLTTLTKNEIMKEIQCPFPNIKVFAFPYGKFNDLVVNCVKEYGYDKAWSVTQGNNDRFTLYRDYLNK